MVCIRTEGKEGGRERDREGVGEGGRGREKKREGRRRGKEGRECIIRGHCS